ncbi:WXG100 family type VII secretion target [Amycolatopsis sp. NPDC026612]|uniref:WXG100 family type VII secretion target n=1 Tax=Amycolatopsis sp. NPDC026612 TaxID=3155466 RepID=UPI0033FF87E5
MTFEALGWDPAPGNPEQVRSTAKDFLDISERAETAREELRAIKRGDDSETWSGKAAEAFGRSVTELCSDLDRLSESYREAGDALTTYADALEDSQADAQQAERSAASAAADAELFRRKLADAQRRSAESGQQATSAQTRLVFTRQRLVVSQLTADVAGTAEAQHHIQQDEQVSRQATAAKSQADREAAYASTQSGLAADRLDAARRTASTIHELHLNAGNRAAEAIDHASEIAHSYHRNVLEMAVHGFKAIVTSTEFDEFLIGMSDWGQYLTAAAPFLGIICPEAAGIIYAAGLGMEAIALAGRGLQTLADHSKAPQLFDAGLVLGASAVGAVGKAGFVTAGRKGAPISWSHDVDEAQKELTVFFKNPGVAGAEHALRGGYGMANAGKQIHDVIEARNAVHDDMTGKWYRPETVTPRTGENINDLEWELFGKALGEAKK